MNRGEVLSGNEGSTVHVILLHILCLLGLAHISPTPNQNGRHFPGDILDAFVWMKKFGLKFVPKGPISNNTVLVYIIAWRQIGDKPLS